MFFNGIQIPVAVMIEREFPEAGVIIYADDVVIYGSKLSELQVIATRLLSYYGHTGIQLNESKTAYWALKSGTGGALIGKSVIRPTTSLKVLGLTLQTPDHVDTATADAAGEAKQQVMRLQVLPLSLGARQELFAAVSMAKLSYQSWMLHWRGRLLGGLRAGVIGALRPALFGGPRAQTAVTLLCLKGHRVDPHMAQIWSLLAQVRREGPVAARWVCAAMRDGTTACGPYSRLGMELCHLGFTVADDKLQVDGYDDLTLVPGVATLAQWGHKWREALKDAMLKQTTTHRSDFRALMSQHINWELTLHWLRHFTGKAISRVALELVLCGGMLTNVKTYKHSTKKSDRHCPWGCRCDDTPRHRYWQCRHFGQLRQRWGMSDIDLPEVTQQLGYIPRDLGYSLEDVMKIQGFMVSVMRESAEENKQPKQHWPDQAQTEDPQEDSPAPVANLRAEARTGEGSGVGGGRVMGSQIDRHGRGHIHSKMLGVRTAQKKKQGRPSLPKLPLPPHIVSFMRRVCRLFSWSLWPVCGAYIAEVKGWTLTGRGFSGFMPLVASRTLPSALCASLQCPRRGLCLQSVVWISPLWENTSEEGFESFSVEPNMLEVTHTRSAWTPWLRHGFLKPSLGQKTLEK